MAAHNDLGKEGEVQTCDYLMHRGYIIRHTNWISGKNELDIVAEKQGVLVIVEVKTRSTDYFEHPQEAVTLAKMKRTVQAAHDYVMMYDLNMDVRFDVASVLPQAGGAYRIEYVEDAFLPPVS